MRVFLTGGTGLIGSHLAELLTRAGHEVVALVREGSDTYFLESCGCRVTRGDLGDPRETHAERMDGCTHVVHSAAAVYAGGSWPEVRATNVVATRTVLSAAADAGVRHAVHVSSVAVYGRPEGPVDERSPIDGPVPASDLYARSKRQAEAEARAVEKELGLATTIVRPAAVYGERDRLLAPRIARLTRLPLTVTLGGGENTLSLVYAGNVADAILLTMEAGRGRATYDLGLDRPVTQRQLLEGIAEGMGRTMRVARLPKGLVIAAADILQALRVPTPGAGGLPLGRVARLAVGENPYPSRRIREQLGWNPPHGHAEALLRTGRWLRDRV